MRGFFRGWRRKLGLLTLMMGLLAMAAWMRSDTIFEEASFPITDKAEIFVESGDGVFSFGRSLVNDPDFVAGRPNWIRYSPPQHIRQGWEHFRWYCRFSDVGFGIHSGLTPKIDELLLVVMPYWTIVLPLTLLSAFLLLSKPRQPNQKKVTELVKNEQGGAAT